jgi:hypothetical protein
MKDRALIFLLVVSFNAHAIIGEESAMMIQLVTNTAQQINELERLVSNTEKYTQRLREYSELSEDHYFKAERVLYLAQELASKKEVQNLGELNGAIRELKYNMSDLRELMQKYANIKEDEKRTERYVDLNKKLNIEKSKRAEKQVTNSINARNVGRANQLTAQNTAMILENQVKMQEVQLEMLKTQKTANRLKAEELEDKRLDEINRLKFYNKNTKTLGKNNESRN